MKKIFYILTLLPYLVLSQSLDQNWVKSKTYKVPTNTLITSPNSTQALTQVNYFDGLGRPKQQILHEQSNSGKDILTHIEYDSYGRIEKEFLPYATQTSSLNYNSNANTEVLSFYNTQNFENTSNPFTQKQFEASPLSRVIKQASPGEVWKLNSGHEIKFDNRLNEQSDLVYKFSAERLFENTSGIYNYTLKCSGYHPNNSLYKSVVKDENWSLNSGKNNTIEEYKDSFDRVILKRTFNNNVKYDTYYVYDSTGSLTYVLPPTLSDELVTVNSNQTPYVFNKMIGYNEFLLSCNGSNVTGGGGLYVKIQNSFFECYFNSSFTAAKIDLTKTFSLELPYLIPDQNLINFNGYTLYIENNTLKFRLNTTQPNCFTTLPTRLSFAFSLNSAQFANIINYTATVNQVLLNDNAYQYKYDIKNRLVEKKLPGKQWEYIVYDKLDRVVATGPAYNPYGGGDSAKGWMITKYDVFNRPVYTGWYNAAVSNSADRKLIQNNYTNAVQLHETKTTTNNTIDSIATRYTNVVFPSSFILLTVNYYDTYEYPDAPTVPTSLPDSTFPITTNVKGLPTGSWVRVLDVVGSTTNELSYTIYDDKYRPVRSYTKNYLGGYTQVDSKIDWAGKTLYTITTHKRLSSSVELVTKDRFEYSDQDKLVKHIHKINSLPEQLLAYNTYDELGQLTNKKVGSNDLSGANAYQKIDYAYTIRGWLKNINDVDNLTGNDLFAFKINYDKLENGTASTLFNGNISQTLWLTSSDNTKRQYTYQYDNLSRLLEANYSKPGRNTTLDNYLEKLSYDKNGNIKTLERNGGMDSEGMTTVNPIDNLEYTYDTNNKNLLIKVLDKSLSHQGFNEAKENATGDSDGITDQTNDYTYDLNGNMITDTNKEITGITYNHLNLPTKILFGTVGTITYIYNAVGQKVAKLVNENDSVTTTNYLTGFQYTNAILKFFPHAEGYVNATELLEMRGSTSYKFDYVFNYTDHLGNVRLSYGKDASTNTLKILEENHYYAFGLKHTNYNSDVLAVVKSGTGDNTRIVAPPIQTPPSYKYKYNGKELQDELGLNMYDYGARNYDPGIGRWMNMDEKSEKYSSFSPYNYCVNNPARVIDPDGKDIIYVTTNGVNYVYKNKNFYNVETGKKYDPKAKGAEKTLGALLKAYQTIENSNDDILKNQLHTLQKSEYTHTIYSTDTEPNQVTKGEYAFTSDTWFNFSPEKLKGMAKGSSDGKISVLEIVVHEMRHQYDWAIGNMKDKVPGNNATDPEEIRAVNNQNRARALEGRKPETSYGGVKIDPEKLKNPPNNKNIMIKT